MNIGEIGRVQRIEANAEPSTNTTFRSNERSEIVAAIRAAVREGGLPEWQERLDNGSNEMQIAFDRESRRYVVKVLDRETQEVVRQIPAEDVLSRARFFVETSQRSLELKERQGKGL